MFSVSNIVDDDGKLKGILYLFDNENGGQYILYSKLQELIEQKETN